MSRVRVVPPEPIPKAGDVVFLVIESFDEVQEAIIYAIDLENKWICFQFNQYGHLYYTIVDDDSVFFSREKAYRKMIKINTKKLELANKTHVGRLAAITTGMSQYVNYMDKLEKGK